MNETKYMIECITRDLILKLMSDKDMNMQEAVDTLYNSDTYEKLKDTRTGLYFQSTGYVYDYLNKELLTGKRQ